ncbi:MAG TPA: PaaX family transcriptional regulator C-terminal domain-containing protein [Acidimicrobiales bacterium]|nr:PaaX family transcriptional regulator C-terminal domain-containing protein [Acidimicrobiales bacterium]
MAQERNIPFSARSVLASALLGTDPPELPVAQLVHLAGLFGITGNRARVALSRMVASGEATTDGAGRYRLSGHLLDRRHRQAASQAGDTGPWIGGWTLVVVTTTGSTAEVRTRRRRALAFARLAELREGTWLRPDNVEVTLPGELGPDLVRMVARPDDSTGLAAGLWDRAGWARRGEALAARLDRHPPTDWTDLAPGFELSATVLRHFQADPLLPTELLPPDWPGTRLRRIYADWDRRYREVLAGWSRAG